MLCCILIITEVFVLQVFHVQVSIAFEQSTHSPDEQGCKLPRPPINGSVAVWGNNLILEYSCDDGLFPIGSSFGSCDTSTGMWSISRPLCVSADCEPPESIKNGHIYFDHGGGVAIAFCDKGFRLTGSSQRHCDGFTWRGFRPRCRDMYDSKIDRRQERDNFTTTTSIPPPAEGILEPDVLDADNTCYHEYSEPPEVEHASVNIVYKYNKKRKQWILIANYTCENTFSFTDTSATYLYCKAYKWIGKKQPECNSSVLTPADPCQNENGGCSQICSPHDGGRYTCECRPGYNVGLHRKRCYDINECLIDNGGCEHTCINLEGSYFCTCLDGYIATGHRCVDEDECSSAGRHSCPGECINIQGSYRCVCSENGFTESKDGKSCVDLDECKLNNGNCEESCINTHGSFKCLCDQKGYHLAEDGHSCVDLDECARYKNTRCIHGFCENIPGSYVCHCLEGFERHYSGKRCIDIDECKQNTSGCAETCINALGNYSCGCLNDGFVLGDDGKTCVDRNECEVNNGGCKDVCINTVGSFRCACQEEYHVVGDDGISCTICDRNSYYQSEACHKCPRNKVVTDDINVGLGVSDCVCASGFRSVNDSSDECLDIDECIESVIVCDQYCINTPGSAYCACQDGYALFQEVNCADVDECTSLPCTHICENTLGSYVCSCETGFSISDDNKTCNDIDECLDDILLCEHDCVNTAGSAHCVCEKGYKLGHDGISCDDVDECTSGIHVCEDKCINTIGSYRCDCLKAGLKLSWDLASCSDINECMEGENLCKGDCVNTHGSYRCGCPTKGYVVSKTGTTCEDIDECSNRKLNDCTATCVNTIGSYICDCQPGHALVGFNKCAPCPKNYYRDENSVECVACPEHAETHGVGSKRIIDCYCIPGYFGDLSAGEPCFKRLHHVIGRKDYD